MSSHIPFNRPFSADQAASYIAQVLESENHSGNGPFGKKCCQWLQEATQAQAALLTPSCTAALEMSGLLAGLQPGDEVIVPSFTFVSTANAFALLGARPVFVDITPDTLNLDPKGLAEALTPKTRAIVPVHYAGVACPMDEILSFAQAHELVVIEDNAHGLGGTYQGKPLGSLGDLGTLSFHETKNFSCGEGGALLVNRSDWKERAQILQDKGTNRAQFRLGLVDKYSWVDLGSSYLLGELPAALLLANLEHGSQSQARRQAVWQSYHHQLRDWSQQVGARQPVIPSYAQHPAHMYYLLMPDLDSRTRFIEHLKDAGILAVFHYLPLNTSPKGQEFGGRNGQCPVAEDVAERLVRLPLYATMSDRDLSTVLVAVQSFRG